MRALLFHLDGKLPNLALMRLSAHIKGQDGTVLFRRTGQPERTLWEQDTPEAVYASAIFTHSRPAVDRLMSAYPNAVVGGTGVRVNSSLAEIGIFSAGPLDYSLYPDFKSSIGFTQRGCRLRCSFCVVPEKEGRVREQGTIYDIWRGDPHPGELLLLDNDFFGQPRWRERISEIREGRFRVSFCQGINIRCLSDEAAEAIASIDYRDDGESKANLYRLGQQGRRTTIVCRSKSSRKVRSASRSHHGLHADRLLARRIRCGPAVSATKLREFGCRPYPMPYLRTPELVGFQRWVVGAYDKRIPWSAWKLANCRPEQLHRSTTSEQLRLVPMER